MATKKKPAPKKVAKPAKKAAVKKPAPKKAAPKPVAKKPAPKPAAKPAPKKAAPKPAATAKKAAPKPAAKPVVAKPAPKPAAKPVAVAVKKQEPKKETPAPAPVVEKVVSHVPAKPAFKPVTSTPPPQPKKTTTPEKPAKVVIPKTTTTRSVKYEPDFTKSVLDTTMQEHTGPTMRYSDADLAEFRELINKKLDAAKKELAYLQGLITRKDESGDMEDARYMTMEDGGISMEREQLSQMASRQITFIDHLEKAIMRIENKTYGICRVTGKLIDKARLKAVPHATLSIEAKQMMNK